MEYKLSDLIARFGGKLVGNDAVITGIAPTNLASSNQITFLSDAKYKKELTTIKAAAIVIKAEDADLITIPKIIDPNPYLYFAKISQLFNPRRQLKAGISPHAIIGDNVKIGLNPAISHYVTIEQNSFIGNNCQIFASVTIGENVKIGHNVTIYPNVTIYDHVTIGDNVVLHAGSVIGSDGFGNAKDLQGHYHRIPQIGGVVIGHNAEIGANTTIDSGTFTPTIIQDGSRIDNLVQIAHNVEIGAHTGIAAQAGIAGNSKIGKHCMLAGNARIADHINICDYTVIGGSSNVGKDITTPGLYSCGMTVMEYKEWAKTFVQIRNITKLNQTVRELQQKINQMEADYGK